MSILGFLCGHFFFFFFFFFFFPEKGFPDFFDAKQNSVSQEGSTANPYSGCTWVIYNHFLDNLATVAKDFIPVFITAAHPSNADVGRGDILQTGFIRSRNFRISRIQINVNS